MFFQDGAYAKEVKSHGDFMEDYTSEVHKWIPGDDHSATCLNITLKYNPWEN